MFDGNNTYKSTRKESPMDLNISSNQMISDKKGISLKDYQVVEVLGKGAKGEVKKVVNKLTNEVRAMKIIKKDRLDDKHSTLEKELN